MYSMRKKDGIWEIIEKNSVVEVFNTEEEAGCFLERLNTGHSVPASVTFNSVARSSGKYTTYVVIPKDLVEQLSILQGDTLCLSINLSVDKKFIDVMGEDDEEN